MRWLPALVAARMLWGFFIRIFLHENVRLIGVEAAGDGIDTPRHAASLGKGSIGVLHGNRTYILQDKRQITETHSISAGLDYPGVGPEHGSKTAAVLNMCPSTTQRHWTHSILCAELRASSPRSSPHMLWRALKLAKPCRSSK